MGYIWYWGSKWNFHTVCWSAVGCEWGTTSVYFGIIYVCFIPSRLPVFAVEPQYLLQYIFIFVKSIIWRTHTKSSKNFIHWDYMMVLSSIKMFTTRGFWGNILLCFVWPMPFNIYKDLNKMADILHFADSSFAPSQWETALLCNDVSHWLSANLETTLYIYMQNDVLYRI